MRDGDRYSRMDGTVGFGFMVNAMGGGGDVGQTFPRSDAEDMSRGARFIPGDVTVARRNGGVVQFVVACTRNCWYWAMPDGTRIYHWDPAVHAELKGGPCPDCGNTHTRGGKVQP